MSMSPISNIDSFLIIIKEFISTIGTFIILIGVLHGAYRFILFRFFSKGLEAGQSVEDSIRRDLGRTIVLGLEFIIAADVIATTTTPDYYSLGILAIIVVIRTFLTFTLNRDISGGSPIQVKESSLQR